MDSNETDRTRADLNFSVVDQMAWKLRSRFAKTIEKILKMAVRAYSESERFVYFFPPFRWEHIGDT